MRSWSYLKIKLSKQGVKEDCSIEIICPEISSLLVTKLEIPLPCFAQFLIK